MVTRNGRFRVSKGYSRERCKRDTSRFVEEDFYREQALRRLEQRGMPQGGPTPRGAPPATPERQRVRQASEPAVRPTPSAERPMVHDREPPPEVFRSEGGTRERENAMPRQAPSSAERSRPPLHRQKLRLRHAPQPSWWGSLWRRLFGRRIG